MEATLLCMCLALPKLSFSLQTCPPIYIREAIASFDLILFESVSDLAGGSLSDWSWLKASLPVSLGGLGTRRASMYTPAAFLASLGQSKEVVSGILGCSPPPSRHLVSALQDLVSGTGRDEWYSIEDVDVPLRQRARYKVEDQAYINHLLHQAPDTRARALALSIAIPHAGDWLHVVPSSTLGLHFHDQEFRCCLQYWLGVPILEEEFRCSVCQEFADRFGDHHVIW